VPVQKRPTTVSISAKPSRWGHGYHKFFCNNCKTALAPEFEQFDEIGQFVEAVLQAIHVYKQTPIHTAIRMLPKAFGQQ